MRLQIQLDAVCTINQYNQGYCKSAIILPMLVYVWADGVYSGLRAEQAKLCVWSSLASMSAERSVFWRLRAGVRESTIAGVRYSWDLKTEKSSDSLAETIGDVL